MSLAKAFADLKSDIATKFAEMLAAMSAAPAAKPAETPAPAGAVTAEILAEIKSQLEPVQSELTTTKGKLTQAETDLATAKQTIGTLQGQITAKDEEIKNLKAQAKTSARGARDILAKAGVDPVEAGKIDESKEGEKDFNAIMVDLVKAGKTKSQALDFAIANHPTEYRAWLQTGGARFEAKPANN